MNLREPFLHRWRSRPGPALISVHRGLWGDLPENSLPAIEAGASLGIVEIDLQLAADGRAVVFHDNTLDRMTGETGPVKARTSDALSRLPLRMGDGGERPRSAYLLPTLEALLADAPEGVYFDFDVKHPDEVDQIGAEIARLGGQERGSLKVDTENARDIERLTALERATGVMVMAKVDLPRAGLDHMRDLVAAGVAAAELWFDDVGQLVQACAIAGDEMAVTTYTLDPVHCCGLSDSLALKSPDRVWGQLIDAGVTVIMTDRAQELAAFLQAHRQGVAITS